MAEATPLARIRVALDSLSDPVRAANMRAYQRHQFEFLGVPTPQRRAAIAALAWHPANQDALLDLVRQLWNMPMREYQYAGIDLLARHKTILQPDALGTLFALAAAPMVGSRRWPAPVAGYRARA